MADFHRIIMKLKYSAKYMFDACFDYLGTTFFCYLIFMTSCRILKVGYLWGKCMLSHITVKIFNTVISNVGYKMGWEQVSFYQYFQISHSTNIFKFL